MRPQSTILLLATLGFAAAAHAHIPPIDNQYRTPSEAPVIVQPAARYFLTSTYLAAATSSAPLIATPFQTFTKNVNVRWDDTYLYVEAKGLPDHPMMIGIKSWQQQVPIPQTYAGATAWRIPLKPVPAKEPMSAKTHFMRGAIALAANGVPIFNALNNRGDDAKAFGERADCIVDQYSGFSPVAGVNLNGKLTLGENTADNGGLKIAHMALMETLAGKEPAKIDGFTAEQRLFLGWAQVWCQNITEESLRLRAQTDPHSPAEFRVNGVVSNMPEFAKAYACRPNQSMVKGPACRVW